MVQKHAQVRLQLRQRAVQRQHIRERKLSARRHVLDRLVLLRPEKAGRRSCDHRCGLRARTVRVHGERSGLEQRVHRHRSAHRKRGTRTGARTHRTPLQIGDTVRNSGGRGLRAGDGGRSQATRQFERVRVEAVHERRLDCEVRANPVVDSRIGVGRGDRRKHERVLSQHSQIRLDVQGFRCGPTCRRSTRRRDLLLGHHELRARSEKSLEPRGRSSGFRNEVSRRRDRRSVRLRGLVGGAAAHRTLHLLGDGAHYAHADADGRRSGSGADAEADQTRRRFRRFGVRVPFERAAGGAAAAHIPDGGRELHRRHEAAAGSVLRRILPKHQHTLHRLHLRSRLPTRGDSNGGRQLFGRFVQILFGSRERSDRYQRLRVLLSEFQREQLDQFHKNLPKDPISRGRKYPSRRRNPSRRSPP